MKNRYMIGAIVTLASATPAWSAPAPRFLQDAVSGDNAEIAMGRLAQQRGASRDVIAFGRTLESDHSPYLCCPQALADALIAAIPA